MKILLVLVTVVLISCSQVVPTQAVPSPSAPVVTQANWLQFNDNPQHSGSSDAEQTVNTGNVASLKQMFQVTLPAIADGAPAYLSHVSTPQGIKPLLFLTTKQGHILALDANTGSVVWSHQVPAGTCKINLTGGSCYTTSSPAIDPDLQYVYSYGLDGKVHKYQVGDGTEVIDSHWPELATEKPYNEKGSSALSIATASNGTSYLYVANGGYPGDRGDYQGHITAINLTTGVQQVFNANCSNLTEHFVETPGSPDCAAVQTAIWARPGVIYDPALNRIFMATGNGNYDPASHDWGDSVFALNPDGTGATGNPIDSYTPTSYQQLQNSDADLGSTEPAILPVPSNSNVQNLAVQGGKDQLLRLINLDNLSGQGGPGHTGGEIQVLSVPQGGQVLTQPAVWVDPGTGDTWVFVATSSGISGLRLSVSGAGVPSLTSVWQKNTGGTSPIVVNGVLYEATGGAIRAYDPVNGNALWSNSAIGGIHWESPILVNGVLYVTDESAHLTAFSIDGKIPGFGYEGYMPVVMR